MEAAKATNNDVIVQVKGNQKTLLHDCISASETMPPTAVYEKPLQKERNRIESRKAEVFENIKMSDPEKWTRRIENTNHYVRDVSMDEDKSRIRVNPNIFATLRSFALNIMRANQVKNVSAERYDNCLNFKKVLTYRGIRKN